MATVPRDGFDAALAPANLGRQESIASPELFGADARRQMETGGQLMDAGARLNSVAIKLQEQDNLTAVQAAHVKYQEAAQKFQLEAREKRTLNAAEGTVGKFNELHEKLTKELSDGLGNDVQKRAFAVMSGKSRLAMAHDLGTFEIGEKRKAHAATTNEAIGQATRLGVGAETDKAAEVYFAAAVNSAKSFAASENYDKVQTDEYVMRVLTNAHKQRIQDLAVRDPARAHEYYKKVEKEIDETQRAEIGANAMKATARGLGTAYGDKVWEEERPGADGVFKTEQAVNKIRAMAAHLPEAVREAAIEQGRSQVLRRRDEFADQRRQETAASEVEVIRLIKTGKGYEGSKAYQDLGPDGKMKMDTFAGNYRNQQASLAYTQESREYQRQQRAEAVRDREGDLTSYTLKTRPEVLMRMSDDEIRAMEPTIGHRHVFDLLETRKKWVNTPAKVYEAKLDVNMFQKLAIDAGLKPVGPGRSRQEQEDVARAHGMLNTALSAQAAVLKRDLTPAEKETLGKSVLDNFIIREKWMGNTKVPMALATQEERDNAVMPATISAGFEQKDKVVNVKMTDIPGDLVAIGLQRARKKGMIGTEREMLNELSQTPEGVRWLLQYEKRKGQQ